MAVTPAEIRTRVEAILATIPNIKTVITDDSCPLTDADLPAVIVMVRRAERTSASRDTWHSNRTVQIGALFTRLCGDSTEEQRTQMLAAETLLEAIPDAFMRLNRLTLNNRPMDQIDQPSNMTDNGLETRPWGEDVYYACTYEFVVSSQRT